MTDEKKLLELNGVSKTYSGESDPVLNDINLAVASGESIAIVGPSGCGKSTLLNLIGALDQPTAGDVLFDGKDISGLSESELARFRNTSVGFIFQSHHLLPQCTALENVLIPTLVNKTTPDNRARAEKLLDSVCLSDKKSSLPGKLSGGEQQRVAVVRALINQPRLLLADEPTGSLSKEGSESMATLMLELNREEEMAMIVVTHSLSVAKMMDHVYLLTDGKLNEYAGESI